MLYLRGVGNFVYGSKKTGASDQMPRPSKKLHQGSENRFSRPRKSWVTRCPEAWGTQLVAEVVLTLEDSYLMGTIVP